MALNSEVFSRLAGGAASAAAVKFSKPWKNPVDPVIPSKK
jgi:hypothetical protein